jgi:hypothetical protein
MQTAINFVNDNYRSTLCLQYTPNQIAIGMIYLTFVVLTIKPATRSPTEITWIGLLEKEIDHITLRSKFLFPSRLQYPFSYRSFSLFQTFALKFWTCMS